MRRASIPQVLTQALFDVYENLGGVAGLTEWASKNPDKFYLFLLPRLLPKVIDVQASVEQPGNMLNAVVVADASTALNTLERMRYENDPHCRRGGEGNGYAVDGLPSTHASCVQEVDGGGTGVEQADDSANAAETRQDDILRFDPPVPLPHNVPVA